MLRGILDDAKGEEFRQISTRMRDVNKYKGKCIFKVNQERQYEVEGYKNLVTHFCDKNLHKFC